MEIEFEEPQDVTRNATRVATQRSSFFSPPRSEISVRIDPRAVPSLRPGPMRGPLTALALSKQPYNNESTGSTFGGPSLQGIGAALPLNESEQSVSWELMRVVSGHSGWVQALSVDYSNEWFATGSADSTIKIWDLASGALRLTLTGHIMGVRALAISERMPYLFSAGEDKTVKCWDLEQNKVIRDFHGHLSGVYALDLHPTLDVVVTGGRDSALRVWDIRTRQAIFVLEGHRESINAVKCRDLDPQILSGSQDTTVRLWDLAAGKTMKTLTNHSRSVRALAAHSGELSFYSAAQDAIKKWKLPEGSLMGDTSPNLGRPIINTLALNQDDNILFAGGDDGTLEFYNYGTGKRTQVLRTEPLPGSIEAEISIMASSFDQTGLRLLTGERDKTVKVWKQADLAAE